MDEKLNEAEALSVAVANRTSPAAAGAVLCHVVPFEVRTLPDVWAPRPERHSCRCPGWTLFAVKLVAPVPPLPTAKVLVIPVVSGRPVALVRMPEAGVLLRGHQHGAGGQDVVPQNRSRS